MRGRAGGAAAVPAVFGRLREACAAANARAVALEAERAAVVRQVAAGAEALRSADPGLAARALAEMEAHFPSRSAVRS